LTDAEPRKKVEKRGWGREHALALVVYAALAVVFTYPLVLNVDRVSGAGDPAVMVWSMAWIQHALASGAPLYDANIFYPARDSLAYTDLLLPSALLTAPLFYATGNALLSWNVVLLLTYVLSGYTVFLLVGRLLGPRPYALYAALFAGGAYAVCPYRFGHATQLNSMTTYWLPLILLFMHRYLEDGRRPRDLALVGLFFALNALSGLYYGIFAVLMMAAFYVLWLLLNRDRDLRRDLLYGVPIFALFGAILVVVLWPYIALSGGEDHSRDLATVARGSFVPAALLVSAPESLLFGWTPEAYGITNDNGFPMYELTLYPGLALSLLALYALVGVGASRKEALYALLGATILVFSLGPVLRLGDLQLPLPYRLLYEFVPGFGNLRVPARMWAIVMVCIAVLAAFGLRALMEQLGGRRALLALGLVSLVTALEFIPAVPLERFEDNGPPTLEPAYAYLAENAGPETVVAAVPFASPVNPFRETPRMYRSTHGFWQLVNGYASYFPEDYDLTRDRLNTLPSDEALAELRRLGVDYVVVHPEDYAEDGRDGNAVVEAADDEPALERVAGGDGGPVLYRVKG
jgi:hypothetical protein